MRNYRIAQPIFLGSTAALLIYLLPLTQAIIQTLPIEDIFFPFIRENNILSLLLPIFDFIRAEEISRMLAIAFNTVAGFYIFRLVNLSALVADINLVTSGPLFVKSLLFYVVLIGMGAVALSIFNGWFAAWFLHQQFPNLPAGLANLVGLVMGIIPLQLMCIDNINYAYYYNLLLLNAGYKKRKEQEIIQYKIDP